MNGPVYKLKSKGADGEMEAKMQTVDTECKRVDHNNMVKNDIKTNIGEMESSHDTIEKEMDIEARLCRKWESNGGKTLQQKGIKWRK